ncbi:hypothetical protein D3C76_1024180 [compost metagenome]
MSKNAQRKDSFYAQGRDDARKGKGVRWRRHPYLYEYMAGFRSWSPKVNRSWLERIILKITEYVTGKSA